MKQAARIENALTALGYRLASDGEPEYGTLGRTKREQQYRLDPDVIHVRYDKHDRIAGFSYTIDGRHGYADVHREGRHLGVWRPAHTSTDCMALLTRVAKEALA